MSIQEWFLGMVLGVVLIVGIQFTAHKLFLEEEYNKAVVFGLLISLVGILLTWGILQTSSI